MAQLLSLLNLVQSSLWVGVERLFVLNHSALFAIGMLTVHAVSPVTVACS